MDLEKQLWIKENLTNVAPKGCDLKVGNLVGWVNDFGVAWQHRILGFNYTRHHNKEYNRFVHLDNGSYWFAQDHKKLKLINS